MATDAAHESCGGESLTVVRGTASGLEFIFPEGAFGTTWAQIAERLAERPDFYRGSRAVAIVEGAPPAEDDFVSVVVALASYDIEVVGLHGDDAVAELARDVRLPYLGAPPRSSVASFERKRASRAERDADLTPKARSLDADFAGARADIATRRARGESSVPKPTFGPAAAAAVTGVAASAPAPVVVEPATPATLYHRGTLRGGRALQQLGTIVVVGDVNPGAELVASGDIVVFGALRGTAHAGARGDATARVFALELAPTQLRIATLIASGDAGSRARGPEVACVEGDRIAIAPFPDMGAPS